MTTYTVSWANGEGTLGSYEADSADEAITAAIADAGYDSDGAMPEGFTREAFEAMRDANGCFVVQYQSPAWSPTTWEYPGSVAESTFDDFTSACAAVEHLRAGDPETWGDATFSVVEYGPDGEHVARHRGVV